jgi:hypothetical protein
MLLNVPVSEQSCWEDSCLDRTHLWSLPSEFLRLNVLELPVANFIFCDGVQSRFTRIMQIYKRIGTLSLEFQVAPVSIVDCTHLVA